MVAFLAWRYYRHLGEKSKLNKITLIIGFISCFGVIIVGNFPVSCFYVFVINLVIKSKYYLYVKIIVENYFCFYCLKLNASAIKGINKKILKCFCLNHLFYYFNKKKSVELNKSKKNSTVKTKLESNSCILNGA